MAWTTPRTWVTNETVTAAVMNTHVRDNLTALAPSGTTYTNYVPALTADTTNPTLGTASTATGEYLRIGDKVHVQLFIQFGTSGAAAGNGIYFVSVPVNIASTVAAAVAVGSGAIRDDSAGSWRPVSALRFSATTVQMVSDASARVAFDSPWTWAASDWMTLDLSYEAA
jgi:hypothetical protein